MAGLILGLNSFAKLPVSEDLKKAFITAKVEELDIKVRLEEIELRSNYGAIAFFNSDLNKLNDEELELADQNTKKRLESHMEYVSNLEERLDAALEKSPENALIQEHLQKVLLDKEKTTFDFATSVIKSYNRLSHMSESLAKDKFKVYLDQMIKNYEEYKNSVFNVNNPDL